MGGYLQAMKRYATFQGRASRSEFWGFAGVLLLIAIAALVIDGAVAQQTQIEASREPGGVVTVIVVLAHLIPSFAATARRLHDTNRSGLLILLNLVPPLNLLTLVFLSLSGTPGPNRYGPDPLAVADGGQVPADATTAAGGPATGALRPTASPARPDLIAEIERLGRLRREGSLSEAEFEVMKAEALARGRSA